MMLQFLIAVLATWRLTHLLVREDGPGDIIFLLRRSLGQSLFGKLLDCFYCSSLWVAAPIAWLIMPKLVDAPVVWLALSGAACLLERVGEPAFVAHTVRDPVDEQRQGEQS